MRIDGDYIILESGKRFYANNGLVGIGMLESLEGPKMTLVEGYDGYIDEEEMTHSEKQELGQFMIERWAEWARIELPRWPG